MKSITFFLAVLSVSVMLAAPVVAQTDSGDASGESEDARENPGNAFSKILSLVENHRNGPGKSGSAPGQNKEESPGRSGDAPGQNKEDSPGGSGDAPGRNGDDSDDEPDDDSDEDFDDDSDDGADDSDDSSDDESDDNTDDDLDVDEGDVDEDDPETNEDSGNADADGPAEKRIVCHISGMQFDGTTYTGKVIVVSDNAAAAHCNHGPVGDFQPIEIILNAIEECGGDVTEYDDCVRKEARGTYCEITVADDAPESDEIENAVVALDPLCVVDEVESEDD